MDEDIKTESENSQSDAEIKAEHIEYVASSPDFIPLQTPSNLKDDSPKEVFKQSYNNGNEKNAQKRMKTETNDGTGKKPRKSIPVKHVIEVLSPTQSSSKDEPDNLSEPEEYYLNVSNLPTEWTYVNIKNFLDQVCGHVDEMEMVNQETLKPCAIRLSFQNAEKCKDAYNKLKDKVIHGQKIDVDIFGIFDDREPITSLPPCVDLLTSSSKQSEGSDSVEHVPFRPWRPDLDMWETDPQGLYGLRPQFLKSLNITPPIGKWVHVTNFRCDKTELKEVMELAGNVLMCCVVSVIHRYAKVMYSHPLEAVQAISMLNGQMYYGKSLKVIMDKNPTDTIILPKGLTNIGLGLGIQGKPIRNIAQEYQRYAKQKSSLINPILFSRLRTENDDSDSNFTPENCDGEEIQRIINEFINSSQISKLPSQNSFQVKNVDELEILDTNSKEGSNRSTPDIIVAKTSPGESRKSSVGSLSPHQDVKVKNGSDNQNNKPTILRVGASTQAQSAPGTTVPVRLCQPSARNYPRQNLIHNPPMSNAPMPTPGHPNYRPGPSTFGNPPRPGPFGSTAPHHGTTATPFMPVHVPSAPYGPQPMPPPFTPTPGMRPQMQPTNFSVTRPFVPSPAVPRPNMNLGNRVTVQFSNLPPSTTFPLLCEKLAQCGQVMSVQLTTPGCAVATFAHPSHAERCFQTFNRMNVDGYIIDAKYA